MNVVTDLDRDLATEAGQRLTISVVMPAFRAEALLPKVLAPLIEEDSSAYATEAGITPRDC